LGEGERHFYSPWACCGLRVWSTAFAPEDRLALFQKTPDADLDDDFRRSGMDGGWRGCE
jgi:hypothetical protein